MKGLVVTSDHKVELCEIRKPYPGQFQAMVKILACGICSTTDIELINGTQPFHKHYPCLLGHEAIGEVVSLGSGVKHFQLGDWVTRPAGIVPGSMKDGISSAWGGFAEYGLVTDLRAMAAAGDLSMANDYVALRQNVLKCGPQIGLASSVLSIALSETYEWSKHLDIKGRLICVNGTGIAGLSLVLWAKLAGAKKIILLGRRERRLKLGKELGADETVNVNDLPAIETIKTLSEGGVDCFIEATGASSQMEIALRTTRAGGTVAVYGVAPNGRYEIDWTWLPSNIKITQHEPNEHLVRNEILKFIAERKIPTEKLLTHIWKLSDYHIALNVIKSEEVIKSMMVME
ncbi:MAG: zinc-binding dehydrogenase [Dyadobacter sp.]|uniref:zinc-dependent alcohol dehydrogenase n=1 Tax=Dyadobacter sp. TaxID=1914288 RepID=UPI003264D6A8